MNSIKPYTLAIFLHLMVQFWKKHKFENLKCPAVQNSFPVVLYNPKIMK